MASISVKPFISAIFLSILLSACGNDIKSDIIRLDEAIIATGISEESLASIEHEMEDAKSPEQIMSAAKRLQEQIERYTQAINALSFKTDEVRAIRDELGQNSMDISQALNELSELNIRSDSSFTPERAEQIQSDIERISQKIDQSNKNINSALQKLKALGADNGVTVQL